MELGREIGWLALLVLGVLFYAGFGITRLLAFGSLRGVELLLAPVLGFSLIVTVGYWGGWVGWPGNVVATAVLALSTLFNLLALLRRRGRPPIVLQHLPIFALACIAFAVAVYPLWRSRALGPVGTNGDQVLYTNVAAHLEQDGLPRPPPSTWRPALVQLSLADEYGFALGFSYLHALIDTLSGGEAHETFALITAVCRSLSVLSYAALAACLFGAGVLGTILVALFTAFSPALLWLHYDSAGMQVMSLSMVPVAFGVAVLAMERGGRCILLPALLLSAAFITHPAAALAFALVPAVLYVALRGVQQRRIGASALPTLALLLALAGFLALPGVLQVRKFLFHVPEFEFIGWFGGASQSVRWIELYGLFHHRLEGMNPLAFFQASSLLLAVCAVAITLYGVWAIKGFGRTAMLSLGILYAPLICLRPSVVGYPDVFFTTLTFGTFPVFSALALGCERLLLAKKGRSGRRNKVVVVALLALLSATNCVYLVALAKWTASVALDFPSLLALRYVKGVIQNAERIHIRDAMDTSLLWIAYFLKDYDLSLAHSTPAYLRPDWPFYQKAILADFVLVDKGAASAEPWAMAAVYENDRYKILRKDPNVSVHLDFRAGPSMLTPGQELRLDIRPEMLVVDHQAVPLTPPLANAPVMLRLGTYAPVGAAIRVGTSGQSETIRPARDLRSFEVPLEELPVTVTLENAGTRGMLLTGWLELLRVQGKTAKSPPEEEVSAPLQEEVLPGSSFFVADGWHQLEGNYKRWTKGAAFALFRHPVKPRALQIEGFLPFPPDATSPVKASILVNGHLLGELNEPGSFARMYAIPVEILRTSGWAELEVRCDRTLNLKTLGLSADERDLGVLVQRLELVDLELPPDGFLDLGTGGARKYLARGWSHDEPWEGSTFVWAAAPESELWVTLPERRDFRVELRLFPFRYPGAPPQAIEVAVNGRHLQELPIDERHWQIHAFKLPQAALAPGLNTLRFRYRYAMAPAAIVPGNPDQRPLAVAVDFIMFRVE
jgi:hypothetical protein